MLRSMSKTRTKVIGSILVAGLLTWSCGSDGSDPAPEASPESSPTPESGSLEDLVQAEFEIEGEPDYMAAGYDSVWVTRDESAAVDRIDPATDQVVATIDIGAHPCNAIVAGFGSIWVPSCEDQVLYRISPKSEKVEAKIEVPVYLSFKGTAPSGAVAVGHGSVWMVTKDDGKRFDVLARIDPRTNQIAQEIQLGYVGGRLAVDESSVWVTVPDEGMVLRVDPGSGEVVDEIEGLVQPTFVAAGEEALWVLSGTWDDHPNGDGSVTKVDTTSKEIEEVIQIDDRPGTAGNVAIGEGSVWVRTSFTMLAEIDPDSNSVVAQYPNVGGNGDIVIDFGSIWHSDFGFDRVWRISPS
jgi:streptogramin lyase